MAIPNSFGIGNVKLIQIDPTYQIGFFELDQICKISNIIHWFEGQIQQFKGKIKINKILLNLYLKKKI